MLEDGLFEADLFHFRALQHLRRPRSLVILLLSSVLVLPIVIISPSPSKGCEREYVECGCHLVVLGSVCLSVCLSVSSRVSRPSCFPFHRESAG